MRVSYYFERYCLSIERNAILLNSDHKKIIKLMGQCGIYELLKADGKWSEHEAGSSSLDGCSISRLGFSNGDSSLEFFLESDSLVLEIFCHWRSWKLSWNRGTHELMLRDYVNTVVYMQCAVPKNEVLQYFLKEGIKRHKCFCQLHSAIEEPCLVPPSLSWESEFEEFLSDMEQKDRTNMGSYLMGQKDFTGYVTTLQEEEKGQKPRDGYVPCTTRWMINNDRNIVGVVRIRHHINSDFLRSEAGHLELDIAPSWRQCGYGSLLLGYGLQIGKKMGLGSILCVVDEDNIGSIRVMEKNGGITSGTHRSEYYGTQIRHYWFDSIELLE